VGGGCEKELRRKGVPPGEGEGEGGSPLLVSGGNDVDDENGLVVRQSWAGQAPKGLIHHLAHLQHPQTLTCGMRPHHSGFKVQSEGGIIARHSACQGYSHRMISEFAALTAS